MEYRRQSAMNCICIDLQVNRTILIPAAANSGQGSNRRPLFARCVIGLPTSPSRRMYAPISARRKWILDLTKSDN